MYILVLCVTIHLHGCYGVIIKYYRDKDLCVVQKRVLMLNSKDVWTCRKIDVDA